MNAPLKSLAFWIAVVLVAIGIYYWSANEPAAPVQATTGDLSPTDLAAIRATSDRWMNAVREKRWDDAAATFTEDATLWVAGTQYSGRAAILKFHQSMAPFDPTRTLHIDEIRGRGDMAFVSGHSTMTPPGGGEPVIVGRYLDVRVRQTDGSWLYLRDMVIPIAAPATGK